MTPPTTYRIVPGEAVDYLPGKTWAYHAACKDWSKMGGPLAYFPGETHYCHSEKRPTHAPEAPAQGPSDSEMLDWLENNGGAISRDNFGKPHVGNGLMLHWKTGDTLRAAIAAAMNGGGK